MKFPFHIKNSQTNYIDQLSDEMVEFITWSQLKEVEIMYRENFIKSVFELATNLFEDRKFIVHKYGSFASGASQYFSDIDFALESAIALSEYDREKLAACLLRNGIAFQAQYISNCRVPIIKGVSREGFDFDISFIGFGGKSYELQDDVSMESVLPVRMSRLILLVKALLKNRHLDTPHNGTVSGHILTELVRFFIEKRDCIFGYPAGGFAEDFLEFLWYFANFDSTLYVIIENNGLFELELKNRSMEFRELCQNGGYRSLAVILKNKLISSGVFNFSWVQTAFEVAFYLLEKRNIKLADVIHLDEVGLASRFVVLKTEIFEDQSIKFDMIKNADLAERVADEEVTSENSVVKRSLFASKYFGNSGFSKV